MKRNACSLCLLWMTLGCAGAWAAPGDLDLSFGINGIVLDAMNGNDSQAQGVAIDAIGRILVGGSVANNAIDNDFAVLRLNADGTPDGTFGSGGRAYASFTASSDDDAYGLALLADGHVVLGGTTFISDGSGAYPDIAAASFNADGSIDTSFGNHANGWMSSGRANADIALALASGPAGFVLAGYAAANVGIDAISLRLDSLGMPLPSFGVGGALVGASDTNSAWAVDLLPNGGALIGGHLDSGGGAFVQRTDASGNPDASFAADGRAEIGSLLARVEDLIVLGDGRVVLCGFFGDGAALVRLNADGTPDTSFGIGGRHLLTDASLGVASARAQALAIDPAGNVVAVGIAFETGGGVSMLALRTDPNGNADPGFGDGGARVYAMAGNQRATSVALQADGAIVVAGYDDAPTSGGDDRFLVMRLEGGAATACDRIFAHDFDSETGKTCPGQP